MNSMTNISHATLNKKAIVSLNDGKRLGHVSDLLIDPQKLSLAALAIKGDDGPSVLPVENIRTIGEDAITVDSVSSTQSTANSMPGLRSFSDLYERKVVDSGGTLLGRLYDASFDTPSWKILFLEVHHGGVFGLGAEVLQVAVEDIRSLGPDLVTIGSMSAHNKDDSSLDSE